MNMKYWRRKKIKNLNLKSVCMKCFIYFRSSSETRKICTYLGEERSNENKEDIIHKEEAQENHTELQYRERNQTLYPQLKNTACLIITKLFLITLNDNVWCKTFSWDNWALCDISKADDMKHKNGQVSMKVVPWSWTEKWSSGSWGRKQCRGGPARSRSTWKHTKPLLLSVLTWTCISTLIQATKLELQMQQKKKVHQTPKYEWQHPNKKDLHTMITMKRSWE